MSWVFIAGLGNPGLEYKNTRHNLGYQVLENLASGLVGNWKSFPRCHVFGFETTIQGKPVFLVKSMTYMNHSGRAFRLLADYFKGTAEQFIVIYDDIHLDLGRSKVNQEGSSGGHNGVESILKYLGNGFVRYRIGIGRKPNRNMGLSDYVLANWTREEKDIIDGNIKKFIHDIHLLVDKGVTFAMNEINQKERIE